MNIITDLWQIIDRKKTDYFCGCVRAYNVLIAIPLMVVSNGAKNEAKFRLRIDPTPHARLVHEAPLKGKVLILLIKTLNCSTILSNSLTQIQDQKMWEIRYWTESKKSPISSWLDKLDQAHMRSIAEELQLLAVYGNELKMPHSKALGKGLFELRERRYGYRIYYTFRGKQIIIVLSAGDKRSQERDIKIARIRLEKN